jgi:hypothetical protein
VVDLQQTIDNFVHMNIVVNDVRGLEATLKRSTMYASRVLSILGQTLPDPDNEEEVRAWIRQLKWLSLDSESSGETS